jgi:hypothetical protein
VLQSCISDSETVVDRNDARGIAQMRGFCRPVHITHPATANAAERRARQPSSSGTLKPVLGLPSIVCTWILSIDGLPSLLRQFGPDRQAGLF